MYLFNSHYNLLKNTFMSNLNIGNMSENSVIKNDYKSSEEIGTYTSNVLIFVVGNRHFLVLSGAWRLISLMRIAEH